MRKFSNFVHGFGLAFSVYTVYLSYYLESDKDYILDFIGVWFLFLVFAIVFCSRFFKSQKIYFIQMVIYASFFMIFFIAYLLIQSEEYFPLYQKHFFPPVKLQCKQILSEQKSPVFFIRYSAKINCEPEEVIVSLEDSSESRLNIKYSSFAFDFKFPHAHFEGFSIQEVKIILPYLYYKFDSRSKMFYSTSSICRRYNLETGEDEILWTCF